MIVWLHDTRTQGDSVNQLENTISQLEKQRTAIEKALAALRELSGSGAVAVAAKRHGRPPGRLPAAAQTAPAAAPVKTRRRRLSAAGRKAIIAAAKKRWAEHRAAKAGESAPARKK
jgi:hypothetical protein